MRRNLIVLPFVVERVPFSPNQWEIYWKKMLLPDYRILVYYCLAGMITFPFCTLMAAGKRKPVYIFYRFHTNRNDMLRIPFTWVQWMFFFCSTFDGRYHLQLISRGFWIYWQVLTWTLVISRPNIHLDWPQCIQWKQTKRIINFNCEAHSLVSRLLTKLNSFSLYCFLNPVCVCVCTHSLISTTKECVWGFDKQILHFFYLFICVFFC
jgi:hypothetical protein